jgi:hypothetical protein
MDDWTTEWPTEPGHYHFYFVEKYNPYNHKPSLVVARVAMGGDGKLVFYSEGRFLYRSEYQGYWQKINMTTLPEWKLPV